MHTSKNVARYKALMYKVRSDKCSRDILAILSIKVKTGIDNNAKILDFSNNCHFGIINTKLGLLCALPTCTRFHFL